MSLDSETALQLSELTRRLANLVRVGTVAELDAAQARVRVSVGEATTAWLPWLTARAGADATWWAPSVGEQVLLVAPSGDLAQAFALPALYGPAAGPPASGEAVHRVQYADGSFTEHNPDTGVTKIHVEGDAVLDVTGQVTVQAGGDLVADAQGAAQVKAGSDANVEAGGKAVVSASAVELNGADGQVVTTAHQCAYTGSPHQAGSSTVSAGV